MAYGKGGGGAWQNMLPWLGLSLTVILTDQFTKFVVREAFSPGDSRPITGYFNLVLAYNRGAAFSLLSDASGWQSRVFMVIGLAASAFIVYLLARHGSQRLFSTALSMILGGAIGNVIDRGLHGHVVDFLDFHWHWLSPLFAEGHFPAFNIADSAICVGAGLLILDELLRVRRAG
jgi:signal peptidase II